MEILNTKKMKLHEIIKENDKPGQSLLVECLMPYKKSLSTYLSDYFCCDKSELILMVTDIFNAAQYGIIVPCDQYFEILDDYINSIPDLSEDEREEQKELINFQSIKFCDL
jgi:hypothetical protein